MRAGIANCEERRHESQDREATIVMRMGRRPGIPDVKIKKPGDEPGLSLLAAYLLLVGSGRRRRRMTASANTIAGMIC